MKRSGALKHVAIKATQCISKFFDCWDGCTYTVLFYTALRQAAVDWQPPRYSYFLYFLIFSLNHVPLQRVSDAQVLLSGSACL